MQINNNYSPNFTGSFRIKPNEIKAKTEIPKLFTKHRQIFNDIKEQGDIFIVLRGPHHDRQVLKYIKSNKVEGIEYFPTITTKSGLDSERPDVLKEMLASGKHRAYTKAEQVSTILRHFAGNIQNPNTEEQLSNVVDCLRLNIEKPQITLSDKMAKIRDEAKKRTLYVISPDGSVNYALLKYDSPNYDSVRCTIDKNGKLIKKYDEIEDMLAFNKEFNKYAKLELNKLK